MNTLFAYGSLMCADIMQQVCGQILPGEHAVLPDYQRLRVLGEEYPAIIHCTGSQVEGRLYRGLCAAAWQRLDAFEGEMYQRLEVRLLTAGRHELSQAYVIHPRYRDQLDDQAWDFAHFLRHGKARFQQRYCGFQDLAAASSEQSPEQAPD